jgi:hypothetical protein
MTRKRHPGVSWEDRTNTKGASSNHHKTDGNSVVLPTIKSDRSFGEDRLAAWGNWVFSWALKGECSFDPGAGTGSACSKQRR